MAGLSGVRLGGRDIVTMFPSSLVNCVTVTWLRFLSINKKAVYIVFFLKSGHLFNKRLVELLRNKAFGDIQPELHSVFDFSNDPSFGKDRKKIEINIFSKCINFQNGGSLKYQHCTHYRG